MSEVKTKKCSGCKIPKDEENFYKNKHTADGLSNYCVECSKENSKKYFQRKREKSLRNQTDNLIKFSLLTNNSQAMLTEDTENLIRLLKLENSLKMALHELSVFKNNYEKSKNLVSI
jgi:hypothetical protein